MLEAGDDRLRRHCHEVVVFVVEGERASRCSKLLSTPQLLQPRTRRWPSEGGIAGRLPELLRRNFGPAGALSALKTSRG